LFLVELEEIIWEQTIAPTKIKNHKDGFRGIDQNIYGEKPVHDCTAYDI
jgi:hypothetical protein